MKKLRRQLLGRGDEAGERTTADALVIADGLVQAGNALEDSGDTVAALASYRKAVQSAPAYARAHLNLGNVLAKMQRGDEADAAYREAMRIQPELATARFNLATLLANRGNPAGAEELLREALEIDPALAEAEVSLAHVLSTAGRDVEAEAHLRRALALRPDYPGAAFNLGQMLVGQDRFDEAVDLLALGSEFAMDADSWMLFALNNRPDLSTSQVFDLHVRIGATIARRAGRTYSSWSNSRDPQRRLRVGYVSGDFRAHPVGMLIKPVLEHHHGDNMDIHCYSNNAAADAMTEALREAAPTWHDVSSLTHDEFAELVRNHAIDILVDLSGHTNHNRLLAFARRPAPVQATWMGYLNTTGIAAMDFRICDRYTDPPGETEMCFTETLVRLRHSQWCYEPWLAPNEFARTGGATDKIRFGSVNNHLKISDACAELWAQILRNEPRIEFTLLDVPPDQRDRLLGRFAALGVDPTRIMLHGRLPVCEYYEAIGNLDVAMDTLPYSGGATTLDTVWMGTPLIALRGDRPAARNAFSIMSTLGMFELIAETPAEYVEKNLRLARDRGLRHQLRPMLRERMRASPLMDAGAFVADLESCYRSMWRSWCESASPPA
ncbi:MAG: tetratricopeptide repeat protein [Burkholderiales bacterium]|nr:tetratricopeptide repeat protein [Burkholderiales bacterium]